MSDKIEILAALAAFRSDVCTHLHKNDRDFDSLKSDVAKLGEAIQAMRKADQTIADIVNELTGKHQKLSDKIEGVEDRLTALRESDREIRQANSDIDLKHATDMAAQIVHVQSLEQKITTTSQNVGEIREATDAIITELDIGDRVSLGRPSGAKHSAMARMSRQQKIGIGGTLTVFITLIADIYTRFFMHR